MGLVTKIEVVQIKVYSPDSEAVGFLLQITMSCLCALSRQWVPVLVLVLCAGCARGGDRLLVLVPGAGAGARF